MRQRRTFQDRPRSLYSLAQQPRSRKPKPERKPASPIDQVTGECWLAQFDPDHACEGYLQRAHLLKEQFLRDRLGLSIEERWEPCWWVPACQRHHLRLDGLRLRLTRDQLPPELEEAAADHGAALARLHALYGPRKKLIERATLNRRQSVA